MLDRYAPTLFGIIAVILVVTGVLFGASALNDTLVSFNTLTQP